MPTYTVRAPNGKTYRVEGPKGASQEAIQGAILKAHPEAAGTGRKPLEGGLGSLETFGMGMGRGIDEAIFGTGKLIGQGLNYVGATTPGNWLVKQSTAALDKSQAEYEPFLRSRPKTAEAGRIGGNITGLAVPGKVVSAPLKVLAEVAPKLAPVVQAVTSGGMSTGVNTATKIGKAVDVALRLGGGAATGAASSAALGQSIDEGAAVSSAMSLLPLVGRYGAGPVWDAVKGRVGVDRAARLFRQALGANMGAARDAFIKGGRDTADRVLAAAGIDAKTFFATGKLVANHPHSTGVLEDVATGRRAANQQFLDAAAGGTATRGEARGAAARQRRVTSEEAVPLMNQQLGAANTGTKNYMTAQQAATTGRQVAAAETSTAKRLLSAGERKAGEAAMIGDIGDFTAPGSMENLQAVRGQSGALTQRGEEAANRGLEAGAQARSAEERLANLQQAGVKPLDASNLSGRFRQMAAKETANPERANVLLHFADEVDRLAGTNGGVIDAFDLNEIRKDAGLIVENMLTKGGAAPAYVRKQTARVVGQMRPVIDDAITAAGGKEWQRYLDTFSTGAEEAKRIEFSDFAREMARKNPDEYARLVQGQRPDILDRFFGKGRFDTVEEALGPKAIELQGPPTRRGDILTATPAGPSRVPGMQNLAQDFSIDAAIKNSMTPGAVNRATELLTPPTNALAEAFRSLPADIGRPISIGIDLFGRKVSQPRTIKALEQGFLTPENALKLLDHVPAGQKFTDFLDTLSPDVLRTLQIGATQGYREPPANTYQGY